MRFTCDFCKEKVSQVKRVALDVGYDRLTSGPPSRVKYACSSCSKEKEKQRLENKKDK